MADEDLALLDRWQTGDVAAGNTLFKRHFPSIFRFFAHKTNGDGDDLVQETFLQLLKNRDRFQRQSSFRTYLFAIARHVLYHHWRKASRPTVDFEEVSLASLSTSLATRLAKTEDRARLLVVMRGLPLEQQVLLEMFYWQSLGREELAEVFEVEPATIGSRLSRARQAMQEALSRLGHVEPDSALDGWARSLADHD